MFSLNKKLCIESILKSVEEISIVTVSHSKKNWQYPDKSGEAGTLDSSNEDEMPILHTILVYFYQFHERMHTFHLSTS